MQCVLTDQQLCELIADDSPFGDLTTSLLIADDTELSVQFAARYAMTLCGVEEAARMLTLHGAEVQILSHSGRTVESGAVILCARGLASALFSVWKAAQVLIEWSSGIASAAKALVDEAGGTPIACTRKQVPNTKALSVKAVRCGGAIMHRLGNSESILVFAEHRQFIDRSPEQVIAHLRQTAFKCRAVIEVHHPQDALIWARAGAEMVQLDKFSLAELSWCKARFREQGLTAMLAVAGGVTPNNVAQYVKAGADMIVTSYPYYAKPKDVQVEFL